MADDAAGQSQCVAGVPRPQAPPVAPPTQLLTIRYERAAADRGAAALMAGRLCSARARFAVRRGRTSACRPTRRVSVAKSVAWSHCDGVATFRRYSKSSGRGGRKRQHTRAAAWTRVQATIRYPPMRTATPQSAGWLPLSSQGGRFAEGSRENVVKSDHVVGLGSPLVLNPSREPTPIGHVDNLGRL